MIRAIDEMNMDNEGRVPRLDDRLTHAVTSSQVCDLLATVAREVQSLQSEISNAKISCSDKEIMVFAMVGEEMMQLSLFRRKGAGDGDACSE